LDRHDFAASTGIDSNHLIFCRQRSEKTTRCAELGITHFVDDRSDVLEAMEGIVRTLQSSTPATDKRSVT
jgi:hypothetical protein